MAAPFIERRRRQRILHHGVRGRWPATPSVVVPDKQPTPADVAIANRLLVASRLATAADLAPAADRIDLWTEIRGRQDGLAAILRRENPDELAAYLCNFARHPAGHGIVQGDIEFDRIARDRAYRRFIATMTRDKMISLAEAVGALAVENPEQGDFGRSNRCELEQLAAAISERLGIDIAPPDIDGGLLKVPVARGTFGERDLNAIYTAWLLRLSLDGRQGPRVCEIGGGTGRVAYWSHRLGLTAYTIVDLPYVNVMQGYYLLKALGENKVVLYGERGVDDDDGRVRILPSHAVPSQSARDFDLVLNQDSFPEMSASTVGDYLTWIRDSRRPRLMSINHESKPPYGENRVQVSVPEAIRASGGFRMTQRFPYWLRQGYVVEIYRVDG